MKKMFLISPYEIDKYYLTKRLIVARLCAKYNFVLTTADDNKTGNSLSSEETIKLLRECDFAIADLSYERPSCYYEVGYLQALNKRVFIISLSNTLIHQVMSRENITTYPDLDLYQNKIEEILQEMASSI